MGSGPNWIKGWFLFQILELLGRLCFASVPGSVSSSNAIDDVERVNMVRVVVRCQDHRPEDRFSQEGGQFRSSFFVDGRVDFADLGAVGQFLKSTPDYFGSLVGHAPAPGR